MCNKDNTFGGIIMKKFLICLFAIALIVTCIATMVAAVQPPEIVDYDVYYVKSGDTLWKIASMSNGADYMDIRNIIYDIEHKSDCNALIYLGDKIYIPVYDVD